MMSFVCAPQVAWRSRHWAEVPKSVAQPPATKYWFVWAAPPCCLLARLPRAAGSAHRPPSVSRARARQGGLSIAL